jgi:transcriptional regulator with XRE-family HTH domain
MEDNYRFRLVNNRTPRSRALGNALRKARVAAKLGLREFAKAIGRDASLLSRWETGDRTPNPIEVAHILGRLDVTGNQYTEIIDLAVDIDDSRWLATTLPAQQAQLAALVDCEQSANVITDIAPLLVPGLLQTSNYAQAIMTEGKVPEAEIPTRVDVRMGRRDVLIRPDNPVKYVGLIGEGALRQLVGTREIMAQQLAFLLEMAARPNIDLRVVPYDTGWHPGLDGPLLLIESETEPAVVHIELHRTGMSLHLAHDVAMGRAAVDDVLTHALTAEDSLAVIALIKSEWESA